MINVRLVKILLKWPNSFKYIWSYSARFKLLNVTEAIRVDETIYDETKRTLFSAEQLIKLQLMGT